jgi:aryl-alcohol dehydrogenase-like predicted oxidoreductase
LKNIRIPNSDLEASEISLGCMRISQMANPDIATLLHTALDAGINFLTMLMSTAVDSQKPNLLKPCR